jgi:hypothetical protein
MTKFDMQIISRSGRKMEHKSVPTSFQMLQIAYELSKCSDVPASSYSLKSYDFFTIIIQPID